MSFWEHLKPAERVPVAKSVELTTERSVLKLEWDDGVTTSVSARALRLGCPCAECVEEWTGRRTLDPATVAADVSIREVNAVGNYALSFTFSDGHRIGIYQWRTLRALSSASGG